MWEAKGQVHGVPGYDFLSRLLIRKMPLMGFPRYLNLNTRDFFYLTQRALLPGPDLAPLDPTFTEDGKWQVVNTGVQDWPPAATVTTLHVPAPKLLPSGAAAGPSTPTYTVTRLDPKQLRVSADPQHAHLGLISKRPNVPLPVAFTGHGQVSAVAASPTPTGAGCIDKDGMLVFFDTPVAADTAILQDLSLRLRCVTALADTGGLRLTLPQTGTAPPAAPAASPNGAPQTAEVVWLTHVPLKGAKRIFEDTPVLHPKQWAILQRKPVPFGPAAAQSATPTAPRK
jgi:hypothetical protein